LLIIRSAFSKIVFTPTFSLFAWLISHQSAVLFSQNKPATSNQPAGLFSQNKSAPAISHQPNEQAVCPKPNLCKFVGKNTNYDIVDVGVLFSHQDLCEFMEKKYLLQRA
jgi:hypothetical protein